MYAAHDACDNKIITSSAKNETKSNSFLKTTNENENVFIKRRVIYTRVKIKRPK